MNTDWVKDYYGNVLGGTQDLKTSACCTAEAVPVYLRSRLSSIHEEVAGRFYGCGSPFPSVLEGAHVLDLGCGTGRDCFVLASLVGSSGRVVGVDMTPDQISVAKRHEAYHADKFGYPSKILEFKEGYIEDLRSLDLSNESFDIVVSNCVLNLSPAKEQVFSEIFRVLKPGGELYFSDVFSDRRLPKTLREDPVLVGECLGGALYVEDFRRLMATVGFSDCRLVSQSEITITDPKLQLQIGPARFFSKTLRAFKLDLEDRCEDYGQVAIYRGGASESPHQFVLDDHHVFLKDRPQAVCSNTARMLSQTRFSKYFEMIGNEAQHFGLFDCGPQTVTDRSSAGACC